MKKMTDPKTGEQIILWHTPALSSDLSAFNRGECQHKKLQKVLRTVKGGSKQLVKQCLDCGTQIGSAFSQKNLPEEPGVWNGDLARKYDTQRKATLQSIREKHFEKQQRVSGNFSQLYYEHMKSEKWLQMRVKIFRRANNICEGCLEKPARDVHHLSYAHLSDELMFELVALCRECHVKVEQTQNCDDDIGTSASPASEETQQQNEAENFFEDDWIKCSGCRFQSNDEIGKLCGVFNIPAHIALADDALCGDSGKSYEPLR